MTARTRIRHQPAADAYRPAGSFDAETRPHPDGWAVWARHTPTKETP